jgi:hypothetical protein
VTAENPPAVPLGKPGDPQAVRASDADRDRVAEILGEALAEGRLDAEEHAERVEAAYRAKTVGELRPLISDLPAGQREQTPVLSPVAAPGSGPRSKNVVAIMSGASRQGTWRVGGTINAVAVCGGVELDLTEAVFDQQHVVINATALCGGVEIRVPENVSLRNGGSGIMGGFEVAETEAADPAAPVILVRGVAICGGVEAKPVAGRRIQDLRGGER